MAAGHYMNNYPVNVNRKAKSECYTMVLFNFKRSHNFVKPQCEQLCKKIFKDWHS
jgi:hypothetical protein